MMRSLITRRSLLGLALLGLWVVAANAALPTTNLILDLRSDTGVTTSGGRVSAWTDQSPAANGDATQATSANRPFLTVDRDGYPVVRFPYGLADTGGTNPVANYLSLPSGFHVAATRAYTVLAVVKPYTQGPTNNTLLQIGTWAYPGIQSTASAGYVPFLQVGNQAYGTPRIHIPCSKVVLGGRTGASATDFLRSWKAKVSTSAVPSGDPGSGGTLGATNTPNSYWYGDIYRICVWNASLSDQDVSDAMTALTSQYSVPTSYSTLVACVGDSITLGTRTTDNQTWPFVGVPDSTLAYMAGISGYKIGTSSSDSPSMRASRSTWIDDLYDSAITNNIVLMHLGTNVTATPTGSGTAATDYGYLTGLCGEIKGAHGWTIYVDTIPQRNDSGGYSAFCAAYNPLILGFNAGTDNIDGVFDSGMNGDSPLGRLTSSANTTYFYSDSTHPNNAGTFVIASAAWARLTGSPLAPISPAAAANSSSRITVSWTDASTGETGFKIYYHVANTATWTLGATASANATSAAVTGLNAGTTYYFKVVSYNGTAESVNNGTVNATTDANAAPVAGILAPDTKTIYTYGTSITFAGAATDAEDVATPAMAWSSDRDGALGSGASVTLSSLSIGQHTITLTATDSSSATGTATITLFIIPIYPEGSYAAPNYYVLPTGNDANSGADWLHPKQHIGATITAAGTAGGTKVIAVGPGVYDVESSGRSAFDTTENGDNITCFKYSGADGSSNACPNAGIAGAVLSSTNFNALWFKSAVTSGTFIWDGISVFTTDVNQGVMFDDANSTASYTLKRCAIDRWSYLYGTIGVSRNITYDQVTFCNSSNTGWIGSNSVGTLTLRNCTGIVGSTAPTSPVINLGAATGASFKAVVIDNCTFTSNYYSNTYALISPTTPTSGVLDVHNCTISGKGTMIKVPGTASGSPRLKCYGNTLTLTADGVSNHDVRAILVGDLDDTVTTTAEGPVIRGNIITVNGTRTGHSNGIFIGKGVSGGVLLGNKIYGTGVDQGIFLLSQYCAVINNSVAVPEGGDAIICEESLGNQIVSNSIYGGSAVSTGFVLCFRDGSSNGKQALKNIAIDNLIYGGGDSTNAYGFSAHSGTMTVSSNVLDWNVYYLSGTGSGGLGVIDGSQSDSRSPLAFINWLTYLNGTQLNDQNSVIADPRFAAPDSGNLTVLPSSPAKGQQTPSVAPSTWNTKGAFSRKAGTIRRVIEEQ